MMRLLSKIGWMLALICSVSSCGSEVKEKTNAPDVPDITSLKVKAYPEELMSADTIYPDTFSLVVKTPIINGLLSDSVFSSDGGGLYVFAFNLLGSESFDIADYGRDEEEVVTRGNGGTAVWSYRSGEGVARRVTLMGSDTLAQIQYRLDSVIYDVVPGPYRIGRKEGDSTIWKKYDWGLQRHWKAFPQGKWRYWDREGNLVKVVDWSGGRAPRYEHY